MLIGQAWVMYPSLWVGTGMESVYVRVCGGGGILQSIVRSVRSRERVLADKAMEILYYLQHSLLL